MKYLFTFVLCISTSLLYSKSLYLQDLVNILNCKQHCYDSTITSTGYYFLGTLENIPPKDIEYMTYPDSTLCETSVTTMVYRSNFLYTAGLGGTIRTYDRYYYEYCDNTIQITYWTSSKLYYEIVISETSEHRFKKDDEWQKQGENSADMHYQMTTEQYTYDLFLKAYDKNMYGKFKESKYPRYRIKLRKKPN